MLKRTLQAVLLVCVCLFAGSAYARDLPQFTGLVKENSPAVVNISTKQKLSPQKMLPKEFNSPEAEEFFDELMKRFFDPEGNGSSPFDFDSNSRGSGFIYSADGYIVTNHHVVSGADEIKVKLSDGRELTAKIVGSDERTDIALLKVEASGLPILKMGASENLEVGEWVLAIGSPFGFDHSATAGIVSATGRSLPAENYVPFIQTDVAINPGNSGGPLFNLDGEVIGINSQIYSRSGGFMGVSFAIPIDIALDVINQLKSNGSVSRGWIGVYIQELDADLAQSFNMFKPEGALVAQVIPTGPAINVLRQGDVILEFDGISVADASALPPLVGKTPLGKAVNVSILRDGERQNVILKVAALPNEREVSSADESGQSPIQAPVAGVLGMKLAPVDQASLQALNLKGGARVEAVIGEPARKTGIIEGDIISEIDGQPVASAESVQTIAAGLKAGKTVAVLVQRDGSARFLAMKIEANATE
ncbi:MAG: DegQ family serine endoprotease [Gammaproteobacteria bacterium]|nr:DegQ family serine endoprotease [Gammaproteobacteria bacterium]MBU1724406.1 DegQ family serine endoprotease [Gammaproteobacteria bacterium]MBU2004375.1 DegQ family serine endoprotease [Gammaproteobacteria bacterium]